MKFKNRNLEDLKPLIRSGQYRVGPHAVNHANCEGFTEKDMVGTLLCGKELLRYHEDQRILVLGYIKLSPLVEIPLHVVIEYKAYKRIDIITAFIPKEAHRVVSRSRLAEMLRHDKHVIEKKVVGKSFKKPKFASS